MGGGGVKPRREERGEVGTKVLRKERGRACGWERGMSGWLGGEEMWVAACHAWAWAGANRTCEQARGVDVGKQDVLVGVREMCAWE